MGSLRAAGGVATGLALGLGVLALVVSRAASAQTTPAPAPSSSGSGGPSGSSDPKPVLEPPKLQSSAVVDYPAGATGEGAVVLALVIGVDGTVESAKALSGEEPFVSAAINAALSWHFAPATKDGVARRAQIRFKLTFAAPVVTPPPPEPDPVTPPPKGSSSAVKTPPPPPAKKSEAVELVVVGEKLAVGVTSFSKAEVRELPGAFGDPFRALEVLPGVTPVVSGLPFFYVRGSPPGNIGYYLDGVRVPYLFHVGLGPSVIHPGMIERVDLYPGGYPSEFGRFAGGIVSGETAEPRHDFHGEGNIRIFDMGALAETGFAKGKGSALVAFRYSYSAAILSLIAKDTQLDYRDFQARIAYDLTDHDRLTLFTFGAYDFLAQRKNDTVNVLFGSEFYRLDLRWDHSFGPRTTLRYAVTLGFDQTHVADQRNSRDTLGGMRTVLHHQFGDELLFRAGGDVTTDRFVSTLPTYSDPENPDTAKLAALFPSRVDRAGGLWLDFVWAPEKRVEITPGVRVDFFHSVGATTYAVDPRLAMRFRASDRVRLIHAYGVVHQAPSFVVPVPGLVPGTLNAGLQSAFQTSAGVEATFDKGVSATINVFHNAFFKMTDALGTTVSLDDPLADKRAGGRAFGLEVFIRKKLTTNLGGFLSYTLSRSLRTIDGQTYPATFDRTHVASAAFAYELGRKWRVGTRLVFYTGSPQVNTLPHGLIAPPPTLSTVRDPAFYRVDLRLEKRWNFGEKAWLAFVMEFLNATLHKETINGEAIGPVTIPSVGVEGAI